MPQFDHRNVIATLLRTRCMENRDVTAFSQELSNRLAQNALPGAMDDFQLLLTVQQRLVEKPAEQSLGVLNPFADQHQPWQKRLAFDPVAAFHLANGAILERINVCADLSDKGLAQSHGVMVNYRYDPEQVEANHEAFVQAGRIVMSRTLQREYDRHLAGRH